MFSVTKPLHLVLPTPYLPVDLAAAQREYMGYLVSVEEIVTMVIFIEYFCLENDRNYIRADYIASLVRRFDSWNSTNRTSDEEFINHLISLGVLIPFNLNSYANGYRSPEIKSFINRIRRRFQNRYLFICENIDRIYSTIASYYRESLPHHQMLIKLSEDYIGFFPKVTKNVDNSLNLYLITGSLL